MAILSVRSSLPYKLTAQALASIDPAILVRLLVGLSAAVNSGVLRSHSMARALALGGCQRLAGLRISAPRLRLPVDLSRLLASSPRIGLNAEEQALALALLEFFIGLLLQFLAKEASRLSWSARHAWLVWQPGPVVFAPSLPPHFFPKARSNPPVSV